MSMKQLIYASRPFGYDPSILAGILATARAKNAQNDITGALICRPDIYLQLLEGPPAKVDTLFENICKDDRHVEVTVLVQGKIDDRLFPDWAMKHDPADTWLWTPEEIKRGALKHATAREVRAVFVRSDRKPPSQRL